MKHAYIPRTTTYNLNPGEELNDLRMSDEVRPLYEQIHCFSRAGLNRTYGDAVQPATGPIRADLLGNLAHGGAGQTFALYDGKAGIEQFLVANFTKT